jgi:hypothetical protein
VSVESSSEGFSSQGHGFPEVHRGFGPTFRGRNDDDLIRRRASGVASGGLSRGDSEAVRCIESIVGKGVGDG